jgi:hypothetical protein
VRTRIALTLAVASGVLAAPAPAVAQSEAVFSVRGAPAAGPATYDRTWVRRIGPAGARNVLVLAPGFIGGAGDFTLVARDLVRRVDDLQVWAWDRRWNAFEDTSVMEGGDPQKAFDYYLNFKEVDGRTFKPVNGPEDAPFAREWGLATTLEDLRRVVLRARAGGRRRVILGGHSLGASLTAIYAAWDFRGRAGYRDIEGMVLIDGGALGTFSVPTLARVKRRLAALRKGDPFSDLLGLNIPWAAGVFAQIGAMFAAEAPDATSPVQDYALLPPSFKPAFPVTNEALFGHAFDADTSPEGLALIRVNAGGLAPEGNPRPWRDGELSPIQRVASTFAQEPLNAIEWYFPDRLRLDVDGANELEQNAITRFLKLRPRHLLDVDVPLYAFQTDLTRGRVLRGARRFVARSDVPRSTLVSDPRASHLDPLTAAPARNRFLRTVVPFLESLE